MPNLNELINEATTRYHTDPIFHATVFAAVEATSPSTLKEAINDRLKEAATSAAALALIMQEHKFYGQDPAVASCVCGHLKEKHDMLVSPGGRNTAWVGCNQPGCRCESYSEKV